MKDRLKATVSMIIMGAAAIIIMGVKHKKSVPFIGENLSGGFLYLQNNVLLIAQQRILCDDFTNSP